MGGSSKSGGAGGATTNDHFGTILIGLGEGPIDAIVSILEDGKEIWRGPLLRSGGTTPGLITVPDRGKLRVRWGVASQSPDPTLAQYGDEDPYNNRAALVADDFLFGRERQSSPNWEVITRRAPNQTLITGTPAQLDANAQANLVAFAAEILTSPTGLGLPNAKLHQTSWQDVAEQLDTEEMRSLYGVSPLLNRQEKVRDIFQRFGELAQIWARRRDDGTIELGRWSPPEDLDSLPLITMHELTEELDYDTSEMERLPTEYTIEFSDAARLHKAASERIPDLAAAQVSLEPMSENLSHPEIRRRDQARRVVQEYIRQRRGGALKGTATVRRSKAIGIRPGDYFRLDIDPIPGGAGLAQLVRCIGRSFGPTGPISLEWESEPGSAPVPFELPDDSPEAEQVALRPLHFQRTISLPPKVGEPVSITILAARPDDDITGMEVMYDPDLVDGTFPVIGSVLRFALPVSLAQAVTSDADTVRVKTFPSFGGDIRADRERWILEDGAGAGETEARDDTLLLVLLRKSPTTGIMLTNGAAHYMEVCSIRSISLVSDDTWDLGVLRGRLGTAALAFPSDGGASFPDAFSHFEGWVLPRSGLAQLTHADFAELLETAGSGFFRFRPYSRSGIYDPVTAHEAGYQESEDWTTFGFQWPGYTLLPPAVQFEYSANGSSWHSIYTAGDIYFRQRYGDGAWSDAILFRGPAGEDAPTLQTQYSVDGSSWHGTYASNDIYMRTSADGGSNWSAAVRIKGEDGDDGIFIDYIFRRASSQPSTPTGDGLPSGWSDAPPTGTDPLWVSTAEKTADDELIGSWSTPIRLDAPNLRTEYSVNGSSSWHSTYNSADLYMRTSSDGGATWSAAVRIKGENGTTGNFIDHVFRRASSAPATPTGNGTPAGWSDAPPAGSDPLWMSTAEKTAANVLVGSWSAPVRIDGPPGANAPTLQTQYSVNGSSWHSTYASNDIYMRTSADGGSNWSAAVRIRGENGDDGDFIDYVFRRASIAPSTPTGNGLPSGWSDAPPTGTDPLWMSMAQKTAADVLIGSWSAPIRLDAPQLRTQYSSNGSSWHDSYVSGDIYMRTSSDGGVTWSSAVRIKGEDGSPGSPGANGGSVLGSAGGAGSVSTYVMTQVLSVTVTCDGQPRLISFSGNINNNTGLTTTVTAQLYRGSTPLGSAVNLPPIGAWGAFPLALIATDSSGATGSQTYALRIASAESVSTTGSGYITVQ